MKYKLLNSTSQTYFQAIRENLVSKNHWVLRSQEDRYYPLGPSRESLPPGLHVWFRGRTPGVHSLHALKHQGQEEAANVPCLAVGPLFHSLRFQTESSLKQKPSYRRMKKKFIRDSLKMP